ncbi:methyltransferase domain-containing protein [Pedobacter sp. NJ-S-72]
MELFAGQSLHSIEALKKPDINVWAIDSSSEMKQIAITGGFKNPAQYIVGDLPQAILNCVDQLKFDCITCLYNGLSNLTKSAVFELLSNCKQILNSKGKIFIELHNIFYIMQ